MGIYDRDYYQEDEGGSGFRAGGPRTVVATLILINVAVFVVDMFTLSDNHPWLMDFLALKANLLQSPWNCWQLVTYGFAHASISSPMFIWHIGMNMYLLWFFGRDIEARYGAGEFLRIYLALIILAGLTWLAVQIALGRTNAQAVGASGAVVGVVVLFALNFPHRRLGLFFLPGVSIPAWVLGAVFVGLDILGSLGAGKENVGYSAHLAGAFWAFVYYQSRMNLGTLVPGFLTGRGGFRPRWRPKLRVHNPEQRSHDLDRKADSILKKIHDEGVSALTDKERRTLEEYSRRVRERKQ